MTYLCRDPALLVDGRLPAWVDGRLPAWVDGRLPAWVDGSLPAWVDGSLPAWVHGSLPAWVDGRLPAWVDSSLPAWRCNFHIALQEILGLWRNAFSPCPYWCRFFGCAYSSFAFHSVSTLCLVKKCLAVIPLLLNTLVFQVFCWILKSIPGACCFVNCLHKTVFDNSYHLPVQVSICSQPEELFTYGSMFRGSVHRKMVAVVLWGAVAADP